MKKYLIVLFCCVCFFGFAQNNTIYSNIISEFNKYNTKKAASYFKTLPEEKLFFEAEIQYIEKGTLNPKAVYSISNSKNLFLKSLFYNSVGDLQLRTSKQLAADAYKNYIKSYDIANKLNDDFLKQESYRRILNYYQLNTMNIEDYRIYSKKYSEIAKDSTNIFWTKYYQLFQLAYAKYNKEKVDLSDKNFDSLQMFSQNNPILTGKFYHLKDIYYYINNDLKNSSFSIAKSKENYSKSNLYIAKRALISLELNDALNEIDRSNTQIALARLKNIFKNPTINNDGELRILIANAIYKAYSKENKLDSAIFYFNEKAKIEKQIKKDENFIKIHEIDARYQVQQKDQKITSQSKLLMNYEQNKWLYLSLIAVVFIVAMYSFVRWKKVDIRRKKLSQEKELLQVEHFQTMEQLTKARQLVIEDNIILKNKSKIYLKELQHIKADDHYLNIFTTDGKNHFVRGKLADIIAELPPNFVKCHRSYIVNKNFVKNEQAKFLVMMDNSEVPISRGFKL